MESGQKENRSDRTIIREKDFYRKADHVSLNSVAGRVVRRAVSSSNCSVPDSGAGAMPGHARLPSTIPSLPLHRLSQGVRSPCMMACEGSSWSGW